MEHPNRPVEGAAYRVQDLGIRLHSSEGPRQILESIHFEVRPGEILGIVGRSGTGKTTLLRVLGGLLPATSGTFELEGRPVVGPSSAVVTVFQDYQNALLPWRTIALQDEVLHVQNETGATLVFITHDLDEAIYLADRVLVLAGSPGRVALTTATELPRPRHQITTRELPEYLRARHRLAEALL
jgi:ABC-type nitrate/sulfonate/bicarbonate transport system ATPase subunit